MKLLIITQTVDTQDPVLGFFVRWLEEFAKHANQVEVICLKKGTPPEGGLPPNVRVHSLGKEDGVSRLTYLLRFYSYIWNLRNEYDAVFVHMNAEYVVLGGLLWRLLGKRIVLWYTHKSVTLWLFKAVWLAHVVCTASKESFRLPTRKLRITGHGIDTEFFAPSPSVARTDALLSVGRLMRSKRHDLAIRAAARAGRELRIIGEGPDHARLEELAASLSAHVTFVGGLTQAELVDEYQRASCLIHTSETGSLDKVVLEALACGLPVVSTSSLSDLPITRVAPTPEAIAEAVAHAPETTSGVEVIRQQHSLAKLIPTLVGILKRPRILFLFTHPRAELLERIKRGEDADTALHGFNHMDDAEYLVAHPTSLLSLRYLPCLFEYDFVFTQDHLFLGYITSLFAWQTKWLYLAMNSSILLKRHAKHPLRRALLAHFWKSYAHIVCISREQESDFKHIGIPENRLTFIPFAVDTTFWAATASREEDLVASVGRDAGRDYATLLAAAPQISHPITIIASRKNIPHGHPIPENVTVLFDRNLAEVRALYERARAVTVVSKDAAVPDGSDCSGQTVILDALAARKAVVATDRPWITDYLTPGEDLLVVPAHDPEALASAIRSVMEDAPLRERLAASGRAKVQKEYTTKRFAGHLEQLMNRLS